MEFKLYFSNRQIIIKKIEMVNNSANNSPFLSCDVCDKTIYSENEGQIVISKNEITPVIMAVTYKAEVKVMLCTRHYQKSLMKMVTICGICGFAEWEDDIIFSTEPNILTFPFVGCDTCFKRPAIYDWSEAINYFNELMLELIVK